MAISLNFYATLLSMAFVLLLGRYIINRNKLLRDYNIPEPVVGGIIVAILIFILYTYGNIELKFDGSLKGPFNACIFYKHWLKCGFCIA